MEHKLHTTQDTCISFGFVSNLKVPPCQLNDFLLTTGNKKAEDIKNKCEWIPKSSKPVPPVPQKANPTPEHAVGREHRKQRPLVLMTFLSSHPHHSYNLPKCCPGRSVSEPPKGYGGLSLTQNWKSGSTFPTVMASYWREDGTLVTEVSSTP